MPNQVGIAVKVDIKRAFANLEENDIKIKSVIEDLVAVTQQSVAFLRSKHHGRHLSRRKPIGS